MGIDEKVSEKDILKMRVGRVGRTGMRRMEVGVGQDETLLWRTMGRRMGRMRGARLRIENGSLRFGEGIIEIRHRSAFDPESGPLTGLA